MRKEDSKNALVLVAFLFMLYLVTTLSATKKQVENLRTETVSQRLQLQELLEETK